MVRRKITTYAMLSPDRRSQIAKEILARRVARIVAGCLRTRQEHDEDEEEQQPEEEEGGEQLPEPMELADPKEEEVATPAPGFNLPEAEAEFAVAQDEEMAEQQAILESIQDEAYVEANRQFLRQEQAASDALFAELDAGIEAEEAAAEQPDAREPRLPPMLPAPGTEIVEIFDED